MFSRQDHEDSRFAQRADELRHGTLGVMRAWSLYSPAMSFAAALGMGLVLWVGGSRVLAGAMTLGELIGFIFYLGLFYEPVGRLHGLNQMLQAARAAGERVFDILDTPEERTHEGRTRNLRSPVHGEVVYENVGFSYRPDRAVLKGVDLRARPGEMIALVGPTGAGKSTLVNLLPAFYELTSGRITIDGQDVSGVALASLRVQIAWSAEAFLFSTVAKTFFTETRGTDDELMAAARAANTTNSCRACRRVTRALANVG